MNNLIIKWFIKDIMSNKTTTTNKRKRSGSDPTTTSSNNVTLSGSQGTNKRKRSSSTTSSSSKSPQESKKIKTNGKQTQITDLPPEMIEQILARTLPSDWANLKKTNPLFSKFISGKENRKRLIKQYAMVKGVSEKEADKIANSFLDKKLSLYSELDRIYNGKYFDYDLMWKNPDNWEQYMTEHKLNKKFLKGYIFNYMYFHGVDENTIKKYLNVYVNEDILKMNNITKYILPTFHLIDSYQFKVERKTQITTNTFRILNGYVLPYVTLFVVNDDIFPNEDSEKNLILLFILQIEIEKYYNSVKSLIFITELPENILQYYYILSKFISFILSKLKPINNRDKLFSKYQQNVKSIFVDTFSLEPFTQPKDELIKLLIQNPIIKNVFYSLKFNFIKRFLTLEYSIPLTVTKKMIILKIFRKNTIDKDLMNLAFKRRNILFNSFIVNQIIIHKTFDPNLINNDNVVNVRDLTSFSFSFGENEDNQHNEIIREHLKKWITHPKFKLYEWANNQDNNKSPELNIRKLLKLLNKHYPSLGRIVTHMTKFKVARAA